MNLSRSFSSQRKPGIWLIIAAFLLHVLFPVQMHMHHVADPDLSGHEHVVDIHVLTGGHHAGEPENDKAHEFNTSPEAIAKQSSPASLSIILFVVAFFPFIAIQVKAYQYWSINRKISLKYFTPGLSPPTRAPPRI